MKTIFKFWSLLLFAMFFAPFSKAQTITVDAVSSTSFCADGTGVVDYSVAPAFGAATVFNVELSDNAGSFAAPVIIGSSASTTTGGAINITIPSTVTTSAAYEIRVTEASVPTISTNTKVISLNARPVIAFSSAPTANSCLNTDIVYTTDAGKTNYIWTVPGVLATDYSITAGGVGSASNTVTLKWLTTGSKVVTVNYTDGNGCTAVTAASSTTLVGPNVGNPVFALGTSSNRCQAAGVVSYGATATNTTGIIYSLDGASIAGGNSINSANGDVTYNAAWIGGSVITATASGCGASTVSLHTVIIGGIVGTPVFALGASSTRCQKAESITYTATAANSAPLVYALDATSSAAGNSINSTNGQVTYLLTWSGTSTITATATGCTGSTSSSHVVTTTPSVGNPIFTAPITRCQGAGVVSYAATATNTTGILYTLDVLSLAGGNTINASSGAVTYLNTWSGTSVITATASGCGLPTVALRTVTITPTVGVPNFTAGTTLRCQGAGIETYTVTSTNNTGITYSIDPVSLGGGNTINATTGALTFVNTWNGTTTVTASATGCNGPKAATRNVTITPTVGNPIFTLGTISNRCQAATNVTYTATAANSTSIAYSLDAASLAGSNTINTSTGQVNYNANWNGTSIITAKAVGCNGPSVSIHTVKTVGKPVFALGATSNRCQGYSILTYAATSVNSSSITYSFVAPPAASSINPALGIVAWDPAFSGTAAIRATETGCGLFTDHTITVTAGVGPTVFVGASPTACQGSTQTYTATAAGNTGITYSIATNPGSGTTINPTTGVVNYDPAFTGSAIITAISTGCGPSTTASHAVVITPVVTTPVFTSGPAAIVCQNPGTIIYTATAANIISPLVYSVSPAAAGVINTSTGALSYSNVFTGTATISVLAIGCAGSLGANFIVNVTPGVGVPTFTLGSSSIRKQGAGNQTFGATVVDGTLSYSLTPASAGSIISTTGNVTFNPLFSGTATITAVAAGCNPTPASTITHSVTVVQTPLFTLGANSVRCQGSGNVTYTASSSNGTVSYTLVTNPASAGVTINTATGIVTYPSTFSGTATIAAVSTNGAVVTDTAKHIASINKAPRLTSPTPTIKAICSGDTTSISLVATTGIGSTYSWILAGGTGITGQTADNLAVINQVLTNSSSAVLDSLFYIVTVTSPAPASCNSVILDSIKILVKPKPVFTAVATTTICSKGSININLGASAPSTFSWTGNATSNITGASSGSGNLINQTLTNTDSSASPTAGSATFVVTTTSLAGCKGNLDSIKVNVNPLPRVTFGTGNFVVRCSGTPTGINLSANIPSSFTFVTGTITALGLVSGNTAGTGSFINQTLINSSNLLQDSIYYTVTPTTISNSPTCVGVAKTVIVTVNPKPLMTSPVSDSVCSQSIANVPLSATLPSTFSWTSGINSGAIQGQTSSTGSLAVSSINEPLTNPSFTTAGNVQYIVTPTTISFPNCVGVPQTINVKVNPLPKLLSDSTRTICSDSILDYEVVSSTGASSTYTYSRNSNSILIPFKPADTTFAITDHLVNFLSSQFVYIPRNVDYSINLKSASGCEFKNQKLAVSVSPTPSEPGISIAPPSNLCLNVIGQNFGAGRNQDPRERYVWSGPVVEQRLDSTFYALVSFPTSGTQFVKVFSHVNGFSCKSVVTTKAFNVGTSGASTNPNVAFFAQNLVCQAPNVTKYQWGFDKRANLDSTIITGATTQNLFVGAGSNFDPTNNYYWVMATFSDGCVRKAYFNAPNALAVNPVKTFSGLAVKVYPNPVSDVFTVEMPTTPLSTLTIEVFDLSGRLLQSTNSTTAKTQISAEKLLPGYYVVVCSQNGERLATTRFIKQ